MGQVRGWYAGVRDVRGRGLVRFILQCVCVCGSVCVHVYNVCLRVCMCMSCVLKYYCSYIVFCIRLTKKTFVFRVPWQKKMGRVTFISLIGHMTNLNHISRFLYGNGKIIMFLFVPTV